LRSDQLTLDPFRVPVQRTLPDHRDLPARKAVEVAAPDERSLHAGRGDFEDVAIRDVAALVERGFQRAAHLDAIVERDSAAGLRLRPIDPQPEDRAGGGAGAFEVDQLE